jgi:hypothetical protein
MWRSTDSSQKKGTAIPYGAKLSLAARMAAMEQNSLVHLSSYIVSETALMNTPYITGMYFAR